MSPPWSTPTRWNSGCNVENASYGLGLCAECGLVSELQRTGGGRLTHFTCVDGTGAILVPCGRCRQLLYDFRHAYALDAVADSYDIAAPGTSFTAAPVVRERIA
ncbi:hypothetical protein SHIRM173S_01132 [Streptomyces hirsutus]